MPVSKASLPAAAVNRCIGVVWLVVRIAASLISTACNLPLKFFQPGTPKMRPVSLRAKGAKKKITGTPTTYATANARAHMDKKSSLKPMLAAVTAYSGERDR